MEQEKKRRAKKEKIQADKSDLMKKMSVIASNSLDNDEDLHLSSRQWDQMKKKIKKQNLSDGEEMSSESDSASNSDDEDDEDEDEYDDESGEDKIEVDSDESIDEQQLHVEAMAEQMEQ